MQPHLDKPYPKLEENIERLAEAEHETRDDAKKLHPDMRPHAKLPEREKDKDRNTIRVNGASPPQRLAFGPALPGFRRARRVPDRADRTMGGSATIAISINFLYYIGSLDDCSSNWLRPAGRTSISTKRREFAVDLLQMQRDEIFESTICCG
jgi:hypothetical protein